MKATPDLFNFIKSLNKFEKRYVTLFLSSGVYKNSKNSLTLFKAISKQKEFDEAALKKQFAKSFGKRLSAEKNKLFDLVMESILFLYRDSLVERRMVRNRLRAWILFHKGLKPLGWKYLQKSKAMAEEYENFAQLVQVAYMENNEMRLASAADIEFSPEKFRERNQSVLQSLSDDLTLHTFFTDMIDIQKRSSSNLPSAAARLENIMTDPLMDPKRELTAFTSNMCRLEIRALYYSMKNNHRESYNCFAEQVSLIEKSQTYLTQNYPRYSNALSNQLLQAVLMREYSILPALIQKRKKALEGQNYFSYDLSLIEFTAIRFYELLSWRNRADQASGAAMLTQLEKDFIRYRSQLRDTSILGMLYVFGCYHFYLGNLKKALTHFNDIIESVDVEIGQNFQCMARLVKLLLHYDLKHYDLLPSLIQSTTRLLTKNGKLGPFEQELLSFCRKSVEGENKVALSLFLSAAKKLAPGYYTYGAWSDFEFEAWAESHVKNKSFAQLIHGKETRPAKNK
jgi:hypothetical protein